MSDNFIVGIYNVGIAPTFLLRNELFAELIQFTHDRRGTNDLAIGIADGDSNVDSGFINSTANQHFIRKLPRFGAYEPSTIVVIFGFGVIAPSDIESIQVSDMD